MKHSIFRANVNLIRALALTLISVQAALYVFMWYRLPGDPSLKGMDFISFYTAGRIARDGNYHQLYDLDAQRAIQAGVVGADTFEGGVNLSQHPPYFAPLLSIVAGDDFIQSYISWSVVRLGMTIFCVEIIRRFLLGSDWEPASALIGSLGAACFFPYFLGFLSGQDTAFIIGGLLLWMLGILKKREVQAGFGLALASLSPLIAAAIGLPLMATRRKAALWFVIFLILLTLYSLILIGFQGAKDFLGLMRLSSQGEGFGLNPSSMYNLLGLLLRNLPELNLPTARLLSWMAFFGVILFSTVFWWRNGNELRIEHIGIPVVLLVFTLPHLHAHALSYLLLPLLAITISLYKKGYRSLAVLLIPTVSTVLILVTLLSPDWDYPAYYLLMLSLLVGLVLILRRNSQAMILVNNESKIPRLESR